MALTDKLTLTFNQDAVTNTVVIDTETLDVTETAIVLTLSAVKFDRFGDKEQKMQEIHTAIDVTQQLLQGRTHSASTIEWWNKQSDAAIHELWETCSVRVGVALNVLAEFIGDCQPFSRGTDFDFKILGHMYKANGKKAPWKFNQVRDVRTYVDAFTGGTSGYIDGFEKPDWMVAHNSLHDCYRDALLMIQARSAVMGEAATMAAEAQEQTA
ncbi:3'-5' exonuclease [Enterovibrio norvegicus]|uniref:3'-5' exonuclease n=1 Tax=Enterovibrio norvegicus TaxID=188144 RepID=UPI000C837AF0|nr:3'-5' exonuclease [Enterovibrio norvegicus]PMN68396.1 hypothetical protein BCT27_23630 [Enterovibrio norvegicus]